MSDLDTAVKILKWVQSVSPDLIPADASIRPADFDEDTKRARDAVIELANGGTIPVGYRCEHAGDGCKVKIRSVQQGQRTELDKIQGGDCCAWYVYAWHDDKGIVSFALIDIRAMREKGWFDPKRIRDAWSWRHGKWDQLSGYIFRYLHWLRDDGFVLFESSIDRREAKEK